MVEDDLGLEALGMLLHALHQRRASEAMRVTRPVVHLGGGGQLAAGLDTGDQQRFQVGAGGIDGSAITGRAGTQNDDAGMTNGRHR